QSSNQVEPRLQKLARPLHPLPLTAIDRRTISRLISDIAATNGPTAATNAHGTLSGYFSWLLREGLLDQSPMLNTNKPKPRPGRDRVPLRMSYALCGPRSPTATITVTSSS